MSKKAYLGSKVNMKELIKEKTSQFINRDHEAGDPFNMNRKLFHVAGLLIPLIYYFDTFDYFFNTKFENTSRSITFYILLIINIVLSIIEILRFTVPWWQQLFLKTAGRLIKEKEHNKMHSTLPFLLANMVIVAFFPKEVAVLSMCFLLIGDPAAAYFGGKFGTIRFKNGKSLQGFFAGTLASVLSGMIFLFLVTMYFNPDSPLALWDGEGLRFSAWMTLICGGYAAFLVEFVSGEGLLDDNMTIPIGSSVILTFCLTLLEGKEWLEYIFPLDKLLIPGA